MAKLRTRQTVIDIETYSLDPYAAIASIGIVDFFVGEEFIIEDQYYANIDQKMNKELGRIFDSSTIEWWKTQHKEVQKSMLINQKPLDIVMKEVVNFIDKKSLIWCQGTDFDIPILKTTLNQLGIELPWKYYNVRDSRTFTLELGYDMKDYRDPLKHHNALDDAICQAKVINHIKFLIEKSENE